MLLPKAERNSGGDVQKVMNGRHEFYTEAAAVAIARTAIKENPVRNTILPLFFPSWPECGIPQKTALLAPLISPPVQLKTFGGSAKKTKAMNGSHQS